MAENEMKNTNQPSDEQSQDRTKYILKEVISWFMTILIAVVIAFLLNSFIIVNAQVTSGSMETTVMTGERVLGLRVTYWFSAPKRGDIVFFRNPNNEKEIFVKRVIGLPGETVEIKQGVTYVDGSALNEPYLAEEAKPLDFGPYEVPADSYFMMGDNRNHSNDSRFWNQTYVTKNKILGKAYLIYYPRFSNVNRIDK